MSQEWIVYTVCAPIAFAAIAYIVWLITGIFDSYCEDARKKRGKAPYDGFHLSAYMPYFIIFFTNIYSIEAVHSHLYADMFPTTLYGRIVIALLCIMDAGVIRLASYAFTRNNIGEMLALLNASRYTLFTLCVVAVDYIYSYYKCGGTDEFDDIESAWCTWIALLIIVFFVGIIFNRDDNVSDDS